MQIVWGSPEQPCYAWLICGKDNVVAQQCAHLYSFCQHIGMGHTQAFRYEAQETYHGGSPSLDLKDGVKSAALKGWILAPGCSSRPTRCKCGCCVSGKFGYLHPKGPIRKLSWGGAFILSPPLNCSALPDLRWERED